MVTFENGEGPDSVLNGFTLQNGLVADVWDSGGGILIFRASPTVTGNKVTNNVACRGPGISIIYGSPLIQGNEIRGNTQDSCAEYQAGGGGIEIGAESGAQILGNVIANNVLGEGVGGGILISYTNDPTSGSAGPILVQDNTISGNAAGLEGGGIHLFESFDVNIIQNVIIGNRSQGGAGLSSWNSRSLIVGNTIADNIDTYAYGTGITVLLYDAESELHNNQIIAPEEDDAIYCASAMTGTTLYAVANNVYSPFQPYAGLPYAGDCSDQTGMNGNISADPFFVDPSNGDYSLQPGSTSLDAGNNLAPDLPSTDFASAARFVDSDNDGLPTIDIGAFELQSVSEPPVADAGLDQTVKTLESVTLDGTGSIDPEGGALNYSWSLGGSEIASGPTPVVGPFDAGSYVITLSVNDPDGLSATDSVTITVLNRAPVADAGPDQTVQTMDSVTLDGTGSADPEGGALSYSWSLDGTEVATSATATGSTKPRQGAGRCSARQQTRRHRLRAGPCSSNRRPTRGCRARKYLAPLSRSTATTISTKRCGGRTTCRSRFQAASIHQPPRRPPRG